MRRDRCRAALLAACLGLCAGQVAAQAASQAAPSERAQRDADKVFQWIKIHSDKPRRVRDEKEAKPAAPPPAAAATPAPRPAARPAPEPAAQRAAAATAAPLPNPEPASPAAVEAVPVSAAVAKAAPAAPTPAEPEGEDPLVFVRQVEPQFPGHAMRMLGKGSVQVRFEVKPDGTVGRTEVVKTTSGRLNQAAVDAVAQWRFQPLRHPQTGIVELGFNLY